MRPTARPVKPAGIDLRVVLAITTMKIAVMTISVMITAVSEKPVGECDPKPLEALSKSALRAVGPSFDGTRSPVLMMRAMKPAPTRAPTSCPTM